MKKVSTNIDRFESDINDLILNGDLLQLAMTKDSGILDDKTLEYVDNSKLKLPNFNNHYQNWYSETLRVIEQLLPNRLNDFKSCYEIPKNRKEIDNSNYRILDFISGREVKNGFGEIIVSQSSAIPQFEIQLNILKSSVNRFKSTLFDLEKIMQVDLFQNELEAARHLSTNGFLRGAGAIAGVVLERHLKRIFTDRKFTTRKTKTISNLNDMLKEQKVIDTKTWRFIQHLGDLRNLCDHDKEKEPSKTDVSDLIDGTQRILKTVL